MTSSALGAGFVFSARELDASEAVQLGLALEVTSSEALQARAQEWAHTLAAFSPVALSLAKQALNRSLQNDLATMLDLEAAGQAVALASDFHRGAVARFLGKQRSQP